MLALDDAVLARLAIAATRIAPAQRGQWLTQFADHIDPPTARRRGNGGPRARWRDGIAIFRIAAHHGDLVHALLAAGRIDEHAARLRADARGRDGRGRQKVAAVRQPYQLTPH